MVSTGVLIAAVVCCILVVVGIILGVWGSGVACPDFGMDCVASPPPAPIGTPGGTPGPDAGTPGPTTGSPGPKTVPRIQAPLLSYTNDPVDCVGSWVGCNVPCGTGIDTYKVIKQAANGGKACDTPDRTTKTCVMPPCGVDCVGGWESANPDGWSECSATCGTGEQTRTYRVTTKSAGSGNSCPYKDGYKETRNCPGLNPCPQAVDCKGSWSEWTGCSKGCGGGTKTRRYTISTDAANGGKACPNTTGDVETETCNTTSCCDPSQYKLSEWADVTGPDGKAAPPFNCDGSAGDGRPYVLQTRSVTFPANPNGPSTKEDCNIQGLNIYRYTGLGCSDRKPTAGTCSDSGVPWSSTDGCTVTPVTRDPTGGECSPTTNPWTLAGCTPSDSEVTPSGGTCSISGISWNSTDGCKVSPATRSGTSVSCNFGIWDGSSCQMYPTELDPTSGTCSEKNTWSKDGCIRGGNIDGTATACSSGRLNNGVCEDIVNEPLCLHYMWNGQCRPTSWGWLNQTGQVSEFTCPSGYTKGGATGAKGVCVSNQGSVTALTCPTNYDSDLTKNKCIGKKSTIKSIDCSNFAGYESDLVNGLCKAKTVSTTDLTCPAGYSKDLTNNKCKVVIGNITNVTGCPSAYNANTSKNTCTAKAATISSLTCSNPEYFKASASSNKCVPFS